MGIMMRQVAGHPLLPAMFALRRRTVLRWLIPLQTKNIVECYVGDGVGKGKGRRRGTEGADAEGLVFTAPPLAIFAAKQIKILENK